MTESKTNWSVREVQYPLPTNQTVTEFQFSNGVAIHYDVADGKGDLTIFLPAKEVVEFTAGDTLNFNTNDQFKLAVSKAQNGVPVVINVIGKEV